MWSRYLLPLLFLFVGSITLSSQADGIQCNLTTLYNITVAKSPTIQRQNVQHKLAEVDKKAAASLFDYQIFSELSVNRSSQNLFDLDPRKDLIGKQINTNSLTFSGGFQRTFRSGLSANAGLNYSRLADNFPFNSFNENIGANISDNSTNISVSISQPLLRGRGRDITTANEKVASMGIESQKFNNTFTSSGEVFNMVIGYWQYLGASDALEIYRSNEARVGKVLEITNELVKADKRPKVDLLQIQADLKSQERQTIQAEQRLYAARQNLGRTIGLSTIESDLLGVPRNEFPKIENISSGLNLQSFLDLAHKNRTDLKSIKKSLEILSVFVDVAGNNMKPQLDVSATLSYGGLDAGNGIHRFASALVQNEGRSYQIGVGISYLFPINNNNAEANLLSNQLRYTDQEIQLNNQIRNIEVNVSIAYNNLLNSIAAVEKSKHFLDYSKEVFANEQYKFQTGLTTLLNLILFQERLTFAQLDYIQNQQQFAIAISNLRYETGTIYSSDFHSGGSLKDESENPEIFYTLPKK